MSKATEEGIHDTLLEVVTGILSDNLFAKVNGEGVEALAEHVETDTAEKQ